MSSLVSIATSTSLFLSFLFFFWLSSNFFAFVYSARFLFFPIAFILRHISNICSCCCLTKPVKIAFQKEEINTPIERWWWGEWTMNCCKSISQVEFKWNRVEIPLWVECNEPQRENDARNSVRIRSKKIGWTNEFFSFFSWYLFTYPAFVRRPKTIEKIFFILSLLEKCCTDSRQLESSVGLA